MAFTKKERMVYRYWDGTRNKACDPLAVQRRFLMYPEFDLETDLKLLKTSDQKQIMGAFDRLVNAARNAFKIEEFSEDEEGNAKGLQDTEVLELIFDFGQFMQELKKGQAPQPLPPNSTGPQSSNGADKNLITVSMSG